MKGRMDEMREREREWKFGLWASEEAGFGVRPEVPVLCDLGQILLHL